MLPNRILKKTGFALLWLLLATCLLQTFTVSTAETLAPFPKDCLERLLAPEDALHVDAPRTRAWVLARLRRDPDRPIWKRSDASHLLQVLRRAADRGLNPAAYRLDDIERRIEATSPGAVADLEILLDVAFLAYAADCLEGQTDPGRADPEWHIQTPKTDLLDLLERALRSGKFGEHLLALQPPNPRFQRLCHALARLRSIAERGDWPTLPAGSALRKGMRGPQVDLLRRRLQIGGDLANGTKGDDTFDETIELAVRHFQARHGLVQDGVVGSKTRAALNVPVSERIGQILVNLERWHWMPRQLGERYILVNPAGFELAMFERGRPVLEMRVISGRQYRRTPSFSHELSYLVLNPYWNVPPRIAARDLLPKIIEDPEYLADMGIRVFDGWYGGPMELDPNAIDWSTIGQRPFSYKLRQDPGPKNPLGRVKFMFPNRFNVYLHDTPKRKLFAKTVRAFSSGCIRVEKPVELATRLLRQDSNWPAEKINATVQAGGTTKISLPEPIPVHLAYFTAWVAPDGTVHHRSDIYGRDARLARALKKTQPPSSPAPSRETMSASSAAKSTEGKTPGAGGSPHSAGRET